MRYHTAAWLQVLRELNLPQPPAEDWEHRTSGVPNRQIFREHLNLDLTHAEVAQWIERKELLYREHAAGNVVEVEGFQAYFARIRAGGARVALATGAGATNIAFNLGALGMTDAFDAIVGADDVRRGKPEPEIFLAAAARLSAAPEQCVVFEDAPLGLEAARRAGMRAVGIVGLMNEASIYAFPNVVKAVRGYREV
jgi:beta-phosphoglucomutase